MRRNRGLQVIKGGGKGRKKWKRPVFISVVVVLFLFLLWHSLTYLSLIFAQVTVARHETITWGLAVDSVVLRKETILKAPAPGEYIIVQEDGNRVRNQQVYARLARSGNVTELKAPIAGLIRHGTDGFEGKFSMRAQVDTNLINLASQVKGSQPTVATGVGMDTIVAIIVDNGRFQLLTALDFEPHRRYRLKTTVDGKDHTFVISVRDMVEYQGLNWVLWDAPSLPDELGLVRTFSGELVTDELSLVLIPERALFQKDDEVGVFVLRRNKPVFNPVEVHYERDEMVGVTGLVNGQRIMHLPNWASFAKRWWQR